MINQVASVHKRFLKKNFFLSILNFIDLLRNFHFLIFYEWESLSWGGETWGLKYY